MDDGTTANLIEMGGESCVDQLVFPPLLFFLSVEQDIIHFLNSSLMSSGILDYS